MTHFWPEGKLIQVEADALWTPLHLTWDGGRHPVQVILDRWRVDEDWWRERVWREYFQLTTRTGLLVEVFHDLTAGEWYVQRVYD
ncbi:MAG TPA: hypothetical protein VMT24_16315 [Aggregatilineaceae bacterium]|nr:hypothetical protein [Aggregatilineaceae bacterium]